MGDQDFDPCECIFSHEMVMRRLLSLLRQSQSYCTDNECYQDVVTSRESTDPSFLIMTMIVAFALFMYYIQPQAPRNNFLEPTKPRLNQSGGAPPTPPPSSS